MQPAAPAITAEPAGFLRHLWASERLHYYFMFLPALLLLIGVMVPFLMGMATSLTNEKLYLPDTQFIGLANYQALFSNRVFQESIVNTLLYVVFVLVIQIPLGIGVAVLLDVASPLQRILRSALVLPLLIPPIVAGLMWKTMMQPTQGILNWALTSIGLAPFSWLTDTDTALISVIVIDTWVYMPFAALILLAGLQSVPLDMLEAARVDGASDWQVFRRMKLPWLIPYILLVMLFRAADAIKTFELIYPTTRGGPLNATRVLHVMAYEEAFRWTSLGRAMAIVFVLWLLSYVVSTFLMRQWNRRAKDV
ncbi:MAG: sugar ABC transporter permease [Chloroflexi bacterium]|nr:sugar ABC transporter permease [Chloroflexota bacterium]